MSVAVICSVLGLPPDRWPPDHYALLGLAPGEAGTDTEDRVLERMERLRPYQLAHPDAVTDAMNRLAQALVCLTDPATRRAYDAGLNLPSTAAPPRVARNAGPAEVYALLPAAPIEPAPQVRIRRPRDNEVRRRLYRRRAAARKLRVAWHIVGRTVSDAGRQLRRPFEAVELVAALRDLRRLTEGDDAPAVGHIDEAGALVGALARQPYILDTFRHLLADQREALAADWQTGAEQIEDTLSALWRLLRQPPERRWRRVVRRTARSLVTDQLNLTLFVLGLVALGIALYRSR